MDSLTTVILLIVVVDEWAVVEMVRHAIAIIIFIAGISLAVSITIQLISVGHSGTVVLIVLDTVLVAVHIAFTGVSHTILISVLLQCSEGMLPQDLALALNMAIWPLKKC